MSPEQFLGELPSTIALVDTLARSRLVPADASAAVVRSSVTARGSLPRSQTGTVRDARQVQVWEVTSEQPGR